MASFPFHNSGTCGAAVGKTDSIASINSTQTKRFGPPVVPLFGRAIEPLFTVREVANALKLSTATVYAMLDRGELERLWVGNSIRIPRRSIEQTIGEAVRPRARRNRSKHEGDP